MSHWLQKLAKQHIIQSEDGRAIFFPYGPFKGYVLPKARLESIIQKFYVRWQLWSLGSLIVSSIVVGLLKLNFDVLLLFGFLDLVFYYIAIRRITKRLIPLPRRLGVRFYALWYDQEILLQRFMLAFVTAAMAGFFLFPGLPGLLSAFVFGLALLMMMYYAYIIWLHQRENSMQPENPKTGDNHTENALEPDQ